MYAALDWRIIGSGNDLLSLDHQSITQPHVDLFSTL